MIFPYLHISQVLHAAAPIRGGVRWVLVCFLDAEWGGECGAG